MRIILVILIMAIVLGAGSFWYVSRESRVSHGTDQEEKSFEVRSGENAWELGGRLEEAGIVDSRLFFVFHLWQEGRLHELVAGAYRLSGRQAIPEIAKRITEGEVIPKDIKVTFPEGWTNKKMAERLSANRLPGQEFLELAGRPKKEWRTKYPFLANLPEKATLEGFLFPDTYLFAPDASAETIIETMLKNFGKKVDTKLEQDLAKRSDDLFFAVTLASIVENEVPTERDRRLVSDLFSRRLAIGQPLQSCATLQYILGLDKKQYSIEETKVESPYNTYLNKGLPVGPVGNPGLVALKATAYPESNPYYYFLSDPKTGETIFSVTFEEHVRNKAVHGL